MKIYSQFKQEEHFLKMGERAEPDATVVLSGSEWNKLMAVIDAAKVIDEYLANEFGNFSRLNGKFHAYEFFKRALEELEKKNESNT